MQKIYEGMFLFDPTFAADFQTAENEIRRILDRANAEIIYCKTWHEGKLAYEIKGRKRGCYILVYFKADGVKIESIDRDIQLSEPILRALILKADKLSHEKMMNPVLPGDVTVRDGRFREGDAPVRRGSVGEEAPDMIESDEEAGREAVGVGDEVGRARDID